MKTFLKICLFLGCINFATSQTFERIETIAGFGVLEENNGVSVADYDGDNDLDIFVVAKAKDEDGIEKSHSRLFKNNNDGTFDDVTAFAGLLDIYPISISGNGFIGLDGYKYGAFWGDYDNDGFPDLFFTSIHVVKLFHNNGNGTFTEVTESSGITENSDCINTSATWFDYNNDGFLDLYIGDYQGCRGDRLYKNDGNGTFTDVSSNLGINPDLRSFMGVPFDFNNDGYLDLYKTNDFRNSNELLINQNGTSFINQIDDYNLVSENFDMGVAIGDYDNNGEFDFFITSINKNLLFTKYGNTYTDVAGPLGLDNTLWSWDVHFSDFDLDGDEDLFILNGFNSNNFTIQKNVYFENLHANGTPRFIDSSKKTRLDEETISVGAGVFDFDNDGDLDVFVTNSDRPSYFYENKTTDFTQQESTQHWFKIDLKGTTSNRNAFGTKVAITTNKGVLHRYYNGKGFLSQNIQPVHFGLHPETTEIQEIKITWPLGLVETYTNIPIDKTIVATEGVGYEILDISPSIKNYGCMNPSSCNYNPNATVDSGSCIPFLESNTISGKKNVEYHSTELYTYPLFEGSEATWEIEGGIIVEGYHGAAIKVKWNDTNTNTGLIKVKETNNICSSEWVTLNININGDIQPPPIKNKSIARLWNETLLDLIRRDYARPTVHARNLFHLSIAMYDAWAIFDDNAKPYLMGNQLNGFSTNTFDDYESLNMSLERRQAISYAAYRLLSYRFRDAPSNSESTAILDLIMDKLGYDTSFTSTDYTSQDRGKALGNYIGQSIINYGNTDSSNEVNKYDNLFYQPINTPLDLVANANDQMTIDPNRWQPLSFSSFIDQSGHLIQEATPDFLSPEWGSVFTFVPKEDVKTIYERLGNQYTVFHDPGAPPYLNETESNPSSDAYKWGFSLVSEWSSHLDPNDGVLWDISPKSIGNISIDQFPSTFTDLPSFYKEEGGDIGQGHDTNPVTNTPYEEQIVPRGDYARVLAEFWADGPDSETPPGHWFTLLNYVSDHELLEKKLNGTGDVLEDIEWDVKTYFIMGGAMHDSAVTAWGIKGWYDYIRPISSIRYMAEKGQSSDPSKPNYNIAGIPLKEGFVELIEDGDPLAGGANENINKIKLLAWKGHDFINDTETDQAGTGWILAENWWPYQRPSFVTPPFAGYVSGHSTYSRAAAEVMTMLTGDEYFPGGYGEFIAKKDEFLVFEEGPSVDVKLQWATYRDASDQCSLSRIWGGIHPPADDIPGRLIGEKIGKDAFNHGLLYFNGTLSVEEIKTYNTASAYPNPLKNQLLNISFPSNLEGNLRWGITDISGKTVRSGEQKNVLKTTTIDTGYLPTGLYFLNIKTNNINHVFKIIKTN